jgi:hypothetical protein
LFVLPTAHVDLTIEAGDDVALSELTLQATPLESAEPSPPTEIPLLRELPVHAAGAGSTPTTIRRRLELASLGAQPGSVWEVNAVARDVAGNSARGDRPLRVRVIDWQEFSTRAQEQLARLRDAVARARDRQRRALERVEPWLRDPGAARPNLDDATAALAMQRQAARPLTAGQDGASALMAAMLADVRRNGLPSNEAAPSLEQLEAALDKLTRQLLPAAETHLGLFARQLELGDGRDAPPTAGRRELAAAQRRQRQSLDALEAALSQLSAESDSPFFAGAEPADARRQQRQEGSRLDANDATASAAASPSPEAAAAQPGAAATRDGGAAGQIDRAAMARLVKDRWGRLPERQRNELLQPLSEEFVPEYAADTEAYFRALAEPRAAEESPR